MAQFAQAGEDAFKPDLNGYLVWLVEWTHEIHLGELAWPYPDQTGIQVLFGIAPDVGAGGDYTEAGTSP
ncbi:hypothetical protein [Chitiniphilus shinanonensis]|uniref:hypothetical protein n=1 Tax=Chitiniphilus shinanonensis TaxID=553088 RepID=UPI0030520145